MKPSWQTARTFFEALTEQLAKAVRERVKFDYVDKNGSCLRDHLLSVERQAKKAGMSLDAKTAEDIHTIHNPTPIPPEGENLYFVFWQLNQARQYGSSGAPRPIPNTELDAYCRLMDERLSRWEVLTFRALDRAYIEEAYERLSAASTE